MGRRLVACPSCSNYVKETELHCIVCGARIRGESGAVGRTAGAMLMGLSLAGCPADDTTGDSMASEGTLTPETGSESSTTMAESLSMSSAETGSSTAETATDPGSDATTFSSESAYGVPGTGTTIAETETVGETETATDTDTGSTTMEMGSTSVSPDYGVPETGR
jgi:hypothetical protein